MKLNFDGPKFWWNNLHEFDPGPKQLLVKQLADSRLRHPSAWRPPPPSFRNILDFQPILDWHTIRYVAVAMTQVREIIQGATYFLTRRVVHRKLLRPDDAMRNFILYSLAVAAERNGVQINAFCAMSTHIHMVVTDPDKKLPHFLRCFHHLVAMGAKRLHNWKGPVWDNARTCVIQLLTSTAIAEKVAYTLANPVVVGEVTRIHQWSGAKSLVKDIAQGTIHISRPKFYFRSNCAKWPETMQLRVHLPPRIMNAEAFREEMTKRVQQMENKFHKIHKTKATQGKRRKHRAATISPRYLAAIKEAKYTQSATFAVGEGHQDLFEAQCAALKSFRASYRKALAQWRTGDRTVTFPRGTWWMCEFHKANIADSPLINHPNTTLETPSYDREHRQHGDTDAH